MKRISSKLLAFGALVIAVVALVVAMVGGGPLTAPQETSSTQTTTAEPGSASAPSSMANPSALPSINASQLPREAQQTLALIAKGGPYPYDRDGVNFGNFEGLLPKKSSGFYKEYTVPTPGEPDRGARRIIVGKDTAKYYTADHYDSFKFIVEGK
ncbi:ribonuclease T1 [Arthrobacter sp. 1088]|uniref:ribonuclease domain-containing protein n=1 Tax=Arthrobacter sp. 1088 TaxID=2817768 RepID=UPI0028578ECF|nr:ribonuclease domain-containing protein [Arthrobacter sp. 1088]MDR6688438.1 ribonuclease T1 [Arthrobacter sp. 1088]